MKTLMVMVVLLSAYAAVASPPVVVQFDTTGQFDINRIYSGTFTASGALDDQGSVIDSPRFTGQAIHLTRTLVTPLGDSIVLEINSNHVSGSNVLPTWCPPPATIPPGTFLFPEIGNWRVLYGTGKYATLQGNGSWAAWVVLVAVGQPVAANECMDGTAHIN